MPPEEPHEDRFGRTGAAIVVVEADDGIGVHPAHLARAFRARYGETLGEYVRRLRLEWAAGEMIATDKPLTFLAVEAGFCDQSHFTRAFKRQFGITPARFRAMQR